METKSWTAFKQWHALLNELCNRAGYFDNATLASAYCASINAKGQNQFEAAVRNLNNWRSGRHVPQHRNAAILARVLNVDADKDLLRQWSSLYDEAKASEASSEADVQNGAPPQPEPWPGGRWLPLTLAGAALFLLGGVAGSAITSTGWRPWGGPADNAPIIPFRPEVKMKVGDSRPIYAIRGDCGRLPPEWSELADNLPTPRLGTLSDGGLARRNSKFCQGLTPANAVVFTAETAGTEEFVIQGDFFKMTVEPQ